MKRDSEYAKRRAREDQENEEKAEEERKTRCEGSEKKETADDKNYDSKDSSEADKDSKENQNGSEKADDSASEREKTESEGLGSERVNETPAQELKRLYRYIMKKLHPDANPDATEAEMDLLRKAQKAYSEGDLDTLRDIADQLDDTEITEKYNDTPEDLIKLRELRSSK